LGTGFRLERIRSIGLLATCDEECGDDRGERSPR
jgi:hypothetical protein